MLSPKLMFRLAQAANQSTLKQHCQVLWSIDKEMSRISKYPVDCIQTGTHENPYATRIGALAGANLSTDLWYDLTFDYLGYLKTKNLLAYRGFIKTAWGEEALQIFDSGSPLERNLNLENGHPVTHYGFLQELPGWKKVRAAFDKIGIESVPFLTKPNNGIQSLFVELSSRDGSFLRTLARAHEEKSRIKSRSRGLEEPENLPN